VKLDVDNDGNTWSCRNERIQNEFRREVFTPIPGKEVVVTMSIGL